MTTLNIKKINYYQNYFAIVILLFPLIIIFSSFSSYIMVLFILCWHIIITLPILRFMSNKYNWGSIIEESQLPFKSFRHPYFILTLSTGVIYPLIWGLFLSLSRYFRLGNSVDISSIILFYTDYIILLFFILPYTVSWLYLISTTLSQLRELLWEYTESLVFSIHLQALQYYDYFRICQLIHKSHFILYDLFFQHPGAFYRRFSENSVDPYMIKITKIVQFFYYHPLVLHFIFLSIVVGEIFIYKGKIYYGIYILFIYPTTLSILRLYHQIGYQNLVLNMCMSDYLNFNFINPRYYLKFWFFAKSPGLWYEFVHNIPRNLQNIYNETLLLEYAANSYFARFHIKLPYRVHGYKSNPISLSKMSYPKQYGIKIGNAKPWGVRLAASYKARYGVRWFHSSRILFSPQKNLFHPFTAKFMTDPYALLALLNKTGQNFSKIQHLTKNIKNWPKSEDLYKPHPNIHLDEPKTLTDVLESNFVMRFQSLATHGVIIGTYRIMKEKYGNYTLQAMQMRPDMVTFWANNKVFLCKGLLLLGIDEKHKIESAKFQGRNQVINNIEADEYSALLDEFEAKLKLKYAITGDIKVVLQELREIALTKDFEKLLTVWSENLHLFPDKWKPPLMIEKTFDDSHLTEDALKRIQQGELLIQKISDRLYTLEVSTETGEFPDAALDNFSDSFIQQLFENE